MFDFWTYYALGCVFVWKYGYVVEQYTNSKLVSASESFTDSCEMISFGRNEHLPLGRVSRARLPVVVKWKHAHQLTVYCRRDPTKKKTVFRSLKSAKFVLFLGAEFGKLRTTGARCGNWIIDGGAGELNHLASGVREFICRVETPDV